MITLLKKSGVALLVLALALIAQIPHAAHVFDRAPYIGQALQPDSAWYALLLAYAYAIALESATLMFVVHGHQRASYGFAFASFAVNLSYYAMHKVVLFSVAALPAWLLAALLPIAIASYSHILTGAEDAQVALPDWATGAWAKLRKPERNQGSQETQPVPTEDATPDDEAQPLIVDETFQAQLDGALPFQLDEYDLRIVNAISNGHCTQTAISKTTGIASTTLKRKVGEKLVGRLPKLCAAGVIHNSSGVDGSEYRLAGE